MIDQRINLSDWLKSPDNLQAYLNWVGDPTTQTILELAQRFIRAAPVPPGDAQVANDHYHQLAGMQKMFFILALADSLFAPKDRAQPLTDYEMSVLKETFSESEIAELLKEGLTDAAI